ERREQAAAPGARLGGPGADRGPEPRLGQRDADREQRWLLERDPPEHQRRLHDVVLRVAGCRERLEPALQELERPPAESPDEAFLGAEQAVDGTCRRTGGTGQLSEREGPEPVCLDQPLRGGQKSVRGLLVVLLRPRHHSAVYCNIVTLQCCKSRTPTKEEAVNSIDLAYDIEGTGTPIVFLH